MTLELESENKSFKMSVQKLNVAIDPRPKQYFHWMISNETQRHLEFTLGLLTLKLGTRPISHLVFFPVHVRNEPPQMHDSLDRSL